MIGLAAAVSVAAAATSSTEAHHPVAPNAATRPATLPGASKAAFVAQANAICQRWGDRAATAAPTGNDLAAYAQALASLVPILTRERADLSSLRPPSDGVALFDAYLTFLSREIASAHEAQTAAQNNDTAAFERAMEGLLTGQGRPSGARPTEMENAARYGLSSCAR